MSFRLLKPSFSSISPKKACQALGACFNPYKALFSRQTKDLSLEKPIGCSTKISSSIGEWIKANLISHWCISRFK